MTDAPSLAPSLADWLLQQIADDEAAVEGFWNGDVPDFYWGPDRIRAECESKRALITDFLAETHEVVEDCWYTCAAATEEHDDGQTCDDKRRGGPCDCGRDARVNRRLRALATPYADRPGFEETWR